MKLKQIRNATVLLEIGDRELLVDPMLSEPATLPGFKLLGGGRRRNPLVALPPDTADTLNEVTDILVTHEHPDHLDVPAIQWIKSRDLPVWASDVDMPNLRRKGLDARALPDESFGIPVEVIPGRHGRGLIGWLMGPVSGFYLAHPDEPSVYITSDTILTRQVGEAVEQLQPELVIAPAGAANFGFGRDIIFSLEEQVDLARRAPEKVVFNHLESLDHCPTTREGLRDRMNSEGLGESVFTPADGQWLEFQRGRTATHSPVRESPRRRPGFQKWLTAKFAGT